MPQEHQGAWLLNGVHQLKIDNKWPAYRPPAQTDGLGWIMAGADNIIQRIDFSADLSTSSDRCDHVVLVTFPAANSNGTFGWLSGGRNPSNVSINVIGRLDLNNDTTNMLDRSDLTVGRQQHSSFGNMSNGWFAGGWDNSVDTFYNIIDRINYSSDTTNASDRADTNIPIRGSASFGNGTFGWISMGRTTPSSPTTLTNIVQRFSFSADTTNMLDRSDAIQQNFGSAGVANSSYGWAGGASSPGGIYLNTIQRLDFGNDTSNMIDRSDLLTPVGSLSAVTNGTYGWFCGGVTTGAVSTNVVQRLEFSNDTSNTVTRGDLVTTTGSSGSTNNSSGAF